MVSEHTTKAESKKVILHKKKDFQHFFPVARHWGQTEGDNGNERGFRHSCNLLNLRYVDSALVDLRDRHTRFLRPHLTTILPKPHLKVDNLPWIRRSRSLLDLRDMDAILVDFSFDVAQLAFHFIAAAYFVHELALERVDVWVQLKIENTS